jgi:hypothetical protein
VLTVSASCVISCVSIEYWRTASLLFLHTLRAFLRHVEFVPGSTQKCTSSSQKQKGILLASSLGSYLLIASVTHMHHHRKYQTCGARPYVCDARSLSLTRHTISTCVDPGTQFYMEGIYCNSSRARAKWIPAYIVKFRRASRNLPEHTEFRVFRGGIGNQAKQTIRSKPLTVLMSPTDIPARW